MRDDWEDLLMREQAHRMANGMAVAAGTLRAVERRVGPDAVLTDAIARLCSEADVQRLLCAQPVGTTVDLVGVLARLSAAMAAVPAKTVTVIAAAAVPISGDVARLIALAVHELVRNAMRHGCREGGGVTVEIEDGPDGSLVAVNDTGTAGAWSRAGGEGTGIVDGLAARLGGRVVRASSDGGGRVELRLPRVATRNPPAVSLPATSPPPAPVLA